MLKTFKILLFSCLSFVVFSQDVDFESPEGWAMAYTSASALNLGQSASKDLKKGKISISAELSTIPSLSEEQQKVGFNGIKDEDLNKSPVFGRLRLSYGLTSDTSLELSWTPPFEIDGAKPENIWGFALSRKFIKRENVDLGIRIYISKGKAEADVTCSKEVVAIEPFTPGNLSGCIDISKDKLSIDHKGIEASLVFKNFGNRFTPWLAFASTQMDPSVKVDAPLKYGQELVDISSDGTTLTYSIGIDYAHDRNKVLSFASSYTPLDVNRPVELSDRDSFWNFKIGYSLSF